MDFVPTKQMTGKPCRRGITVLSSIISVVAKKYGVAALAVVLGLGVASVSFFHWKNSIIEQGHEQGVAECNEERSRANEKVTEAYQAAVDALIAKNHTNKMEFENALNAYANRPANVVIQRVPVRVKAVCPPGNTETRSAESGIGGTGISGQIVEAELSERATRSIERITNDIELLQRQCLLVKEAQRINQGD